MLVINAVFIIVVIYFLIKPITYWKRKKIKYIKPVPFFGNALPLITRTVSFDKIVENCYTQFPNERYVGIYLFSTPSLIIKDPEIIKNICLIDFDSFPDHKPLSTVDVDPCWSQNLFAIQGYQKWHLLRKILRPAYTSGNMKNMFTVMQDCTERLLRSFSQTNEDIIEIEVKDVLARLACNILATTGFGVTFKTFAQPKNEFYKVIKELNNFSGMKQIQQNLSFYIPTVFNLPIISKKITTFFGELLMETIKYRNDTGITRPDVLQLLTEAQSFQLKSYVSDKSVDSEIITAKKSTESNLKITHEIITAIAINFFFAGVDSVSTFISYTLYELALNKEIQQRLYKEIEETIKNSDEGLTYDVLTNMKFLDMVISESLRKWPPFAITDRKSARPYTIQAKTPEERDLTLEKDTIVIFPILSLHRDPNLFPNPDRFDPERFSDENKALIVPYSYIPLGAGPRKCIGSRFAITEGKLVVAQIVRNFEIVPTAKTEESIVFDRNNAFPFPKGGIYVGLKKRNK